MPWVYLIVAGCLEIVWAVGLKYTEGWTRLWPSALTIGTMAASVYCLALAVKEIPIGTGYAIWTGIGAAGTALAGVVLFSESLSPSRLVCILVIVAGIIGLKMTAQ